MFPRLRSLLLLALYQSCLFVGILLLPVALVARRVGIPFPFHRVVRRLADATERGLPN
ncbi:hypothetical protein [Halomarina litorea]|uniref:hypothetical protein n=1 Tax=Halomarina litorea TaxID=2961595 RepID=UPI0020C572E9|nr:hypothetical protein [Halomarina sp. BCD28]